MVDFPGYGYAKVSATERKKWAKLIEDFFTNSKMINLVIHIIDARHKPTELDLKLNQLLKDLNLPYIFLLNKSDKLKQSEFKQSFKNLSEEFPEAKLNENTFFYSAIKGTGKKEIKSYLLSTFYS
jgi:GTP-binding protein